MIAREITKEEVVGRKGPPGGVMPVYRGDDETLYGFLVCCPGCGQASVVGTCDTAEPRWDLRIRRADLATMCLEPRIECMVCGWMGVLRNGVWNT